MPCQRLSATTATDRASLDRVWQRLTETLDHEGETTMESLKRTVSFPDGLKLEGPGAGAILSPFTKVVSPARPNAKARTVTPSATTPQ